MHFMHADTHTMRVLRWGRTFVHRGVSVHDHCGERSDMAMTEVIFVFPFYLVRSSSRSDMSPFKAAVPVQVRCGSPAAMPLPWCLRLIGQDIGPCDSLRAALRAVALCIALRRLSSRQYGFESNLTHHAKGRPPSRKPPNIFIIPYSSAPVNPLFLQDFGLFFMEHPILKRC